jgi:two-component system, OmpR family, alkaline phosphatase synthesis response regulator PhoP
VINRKAASVYLKGVPIVFSKPEFDLLFFLAQNPKKLITVDNLVSNIWGSDMYSLTSSIEFYIESIARKLDNKWITYLGHGKYKFNPH